MTYTFDGANKLVILDAGTTALSVKDLYSRWKDWVMTGDNSKYVYAFSSIGGDPIGSGLYVAPYIFLNTTDGWMIRPQELDHEVRITGNLYSLDPNLTMFTPTLGDFVVTIIIERSSAAIAVTVGGVDQATVQAALTAQGYTTARAPKIDNLDATVSSRTSQGLTDNQATMLLELYNIMGLDPTKPLIVSTTQRRVSDGSDIEQTISTAGDGTVTVTRV